ncbi:MAG: glycosyltransferase family 4 protein [Ignavibacteriaceae bacterium]|nr:glycosyltransferase family 4 protein [Ignavibacteriaceae bacterium]
MDKNYQMNSAKHILFLVPGFPADENDFNCVPPLQEFLLKLKSSYPSARISVLAFQYPYRNTQYIWNGINIFPMAGKNQVYMKPLVWLRAIKTAKNLSKENHVDVIHSLWLGECAMIGNLLSKKCNCEHICTLMGQDVKSNNRYLRLSKSERIKIFALSQNQSDQFIKLTNRKVNGIIHWGIEDQKLENLGRDIDLLAVGSLIPLKNYSLLIKVVAELKRMYPDLNCKLVGTGPELAVLKNMANEKGVRENIEFTGLLSRQEIFMLMQRSKIFVHPSTFEGLGYVFAEALVNGMNIVSFNVGCAQPHAKWFIAKNEEDFLSITKKLLSTTLDYNSVNLFPMKETLEQYAAIYGVN